jgi:hypothetical protein
MSDEPTTPGNGETQTTRPVLATVKIELVDLVSGKLAVTGSFPSLDVALNMLAQATREIEAQWRFMRAQVFQQQQIEAAQAEAIRRDLTKRI